MNVDSLLQWKEKRQEKKLRCNMKKKKIIIWGINILVGFLLILSLYRLSQCGEPVIVEDVIEDMLEEDSIECIGEVIWRVNKEESCEVLFTSVDFHAPEMGGVIDSLNSLYGEPYEVEDGDIKWSSSTDQNNPLDGNSTLVHLRRVHANEGGTLLIFTSLVIT